ncbi:MAG: tRNA-dihydrouridine synthase family protein [Candidatus Magasanikbacteria bacterium]|nr:tRNA-dihydrouridine synthase family protein [Candidatus Magasanikbacteria bacterium]
MIKGFWGKLKKPIMVLAPMANVTDCAFRRIIAKHGKPDVIWTEFVACDGLMSRGREHLMIDLKYDESERPIVAQIFGSKPENFFKTAQLIKELGFDGIDINMGCPDRNVEKQGAGACMIKNPDLAKEVILATMAGAPDLPVSVKTRIGYNKNMLAEWLPALLSTNLAAITVHARTRKEMSLVPARWEHVKEAVQIRDAIQTGEDKTLILGNGDVKNLTEAYQRVEETGCDGVMIGRGIFGNPWLFNKDMIGQEIPTPQKLKVMVEHTKLFEELLGEHKGFELMKKHYKAYVNGFDNAKELRIELMEKAENATVVENIINDFLAKNF